MVEIQSLMSNFQLTGVNKYQSEETGNIVFLQSGKASGDYDGSNRDSKSERNLGHITFNGYG